MDPVEPWIDGDAVRRLAAQLLSSPGGSEIADSPDAGFGPGFEGFTSGVSAPRRTVEEPAVTVDEPTVAPVPASVPVSRPPASVPAAPQPRRDVSDELVAQGRVTERVVAAKAASPERGDSEAKPFLASGEGDDAGISKEGSVDHPFQTIPKPDAGAGSEAKRGPLMERMLLFRDWLSRHAGARSVFVLDRDGQPVLDDPAYSKLHFLARSLSQAYRPVPGQPGNVHVKVGSDAYLVVIPVETDFGCLVLGAVLPRPLDAPSVEMVAKALADASRPRRS